MKDSLLALIGAGLVLLYRYRFNLKGWRLWAAFLGTAIPLGVLSVILFPPTL